MAERHDELEARRLFRQRLDELAQQHPWLLSPDAQERLSDALEQLALTQDDEEETPCHPKDGSLDAKKHR